MSEISELVSSVNELQNKLTEAINAVSMTDEVTIYINQAAGNSSASGLSANDAVNSMQAGLEKYPRAYSIIYKFEADYVVSRNEEIATDRQLKVLLDLNTFSISQSSRVVSSGNSTYTHHVVPFSIATKALSTEIKSGRLNYVAKTRYAGGEENGNSFFIGAEAVTIKLLMTERYSQALRLSHIQLNVVDIDGNLIELPDINKSLLCGGVHGRHTYANADNMHAVIARNCSIKSLNAAGDVQHVGVTSSMLDELNNVSIKNLSHYQISSLNIEDLSND